MTTETHPLTEAEADYLTSLAAAADSYRRILAELATAVESETNLLVESMLIMTIAVDCVGQLVGANKVEKD